MAGKIGSTRDFTDIATSTRVNINSVTATTLVAAKTNRIFFEVYLDAGTTDIDAFIRLYAATTDTLKQGAVLSRRLSGNDNLFKPVWTMTEGSIYTGEISAISLSGTFDLLITEY